MPGPADGGALDQVWLLPDRSGQAAGRAGGVPALPRPGRLPRVGAVRAAPAGHDRGCDLSWCLRTSGYRSEEARPR